MYTNIDSNNSHSSPARYLGKLDSQTGRQKSFKGGNDEVTSASVEPWIYQNSMSYWRRLDMILLYSPTVYTM
jgi:hypothetical protein